MTADREAAIREAGRLGFTPCEKCSAPWDRDCDGHKLCAQDAVDYYLAELAAAREREDVQKWLLRAAVEREQLAAVRDYEWFPGQPATDVREIARAALAAPSTEPDA
jgi:hypothetical protein